MPRGYRKRPKRIGEKLRLIRESLGLSQDGILSKLTLDNPSLNRSHISAFELGKREPDLIALMAYADLVNVCLDVIVRDEYDLPDTLPTKIVFHHHSHS